jgi:hypothetical protein
MSEKQEVVIEKTTVAEFNDVESATHELEFVKPSPEELKAVIWKLDRRIIPYLGLLYLCSFLDRVNIGNAKVAHITTDLNISGNEYNVALSLFFVGYVSIYKHI